MFPPEAEVNFRANKNFGIIFWDHMARVDTSIFLFIHGQFWTYLYSENI